jgi:predicted nucleic-acid-binding Zn-ribbon protein
VAQPKQCPKCSGSLAEGFVVDVSHGTMAVSSWIEGAPEKSVWTGLKLSGKARSEIATWRCKRCGFLEQYAAAMPDRSQETQQHKQLMLVLAITLAVVVAVLGLALLLR